MILPAPVARPHRRRAISGAAENVARDLTRFRRWAFARIAVRNINPRNVWIAARAIRSGRGPCRRRCRRRHEGFPKSKVRNPKSEVRNPKSERNPKPECRIMGAARDFTCIFSKRRQTHFGFRISACFRSSGIRISDFGFRGLYSWRGLGIRAARRQTLRWRRERSQRDRCHHAAEFGVRAPARTRGRNLGGRARGWGPQIGSCRCCRPGWFPRPPTGRR